VATSWQLIATVAFKADVMAGKRTLNLRQVKALAEQFGLSMDALA